MIQARRYRKEIFFGILDLFSGGIVPGLKVNVCKNNPHLDKLNVSLVTILAEKRSKFKKICRYISIVKVFLITFQKKRLADIATA